MALPEKCFSESSDSDPGYDSFDDDEESTHEDESPNPEQKSADGDDALPGDNPTMQGIISEEEEGNIYQRRRPQNVPTSTTPTVRTGPSFKELTDFSGITISGGDGEGGFINDVDEHDFNRTILGNFKALGCSELTAVQKATWFLMLKKFKYNLMVRSPTGSGKTLAFLIPILQNVFELKGFYKKHNERRPKNAPLAVIFAPTKELVKQIYQWASHLARGTDIGVAESTSRLHLGSGCDIFVTTGGGMARVMETEERKYQLLQLEHVQFVVIDEAHAYKCSTQGENLKKALAEIRESNPQSRIFAFSATLQDHFTELMEDGYFEVFSERLVPQTMDHKTLIVKGTQAKTAILGLLGHIKKEHGGELPRILIFTNRRGVTDILAFHLTANGLPALPYSSAFPDRTRAEIKRAFLSGETRIIVGTDKLCAGVDWDVDVVINYHLPPYEHFHRFSHRIGRTARAGRHGTIYSFYHIGHVIQDQVPPKDLVFTLKEFNFDVPPYLQQFDADEDDYPCFKMEPENPPAGSSTSGC